MIRRNTYIVLDGLIISKQVDIYAGWLADSLFLK